MTTVPECTPDLLRSLFLFEALSDDRLEYLCERGQVVRVEPGWLYREGDDATCFYVLLDGSLVMSRNVGGDEVEVNRSSYRGAYVGAWNAYLGDLVPQVYDQSVRVTETSRLLRAGRHGAARHHARLVPDGPAPAVGPVPGVHHPAAQHRAAGAAARARLAVGRASPTS